MEYQKEGRVYKIVMTIIVTALITALVTTVMVYNFFTKTNTGKQEVLSQIVTSTDNSLSTKLQYIRTFIDKQYVGTVDEAKLEEGAIRGYVDGLGDEYTQYLTPDEYESIMVSINGDYVGIGIYMGQTIDGDIIVILPIEGTPAAEVGLESGDIITKVNGEDCKGLDTGLIASKIKGEAGTKVQLEILREEETFTVEVERREIAIQHIYSEVLENNIGYIDIMSFDTGCANEFKEHLQQLIDKEVKSLIIDLRGNGGGVVSETITMAEMFLPKDSIIMKTYDKDNKEKTIQSQNSNPTNLKMVIMIDENSASASEIFTAALQDNECATVVGVTSFGKGCMQVIQPLQIGGALKITIQEFRTPDGDIIDGIGIKPDVEIEDDYQSEEDIQLEKAIELLK